MNDTIDMSNWLKVWSSANETQRRLFAAVKALELGWGGITTVSEITGMSHTTIEKGIEELRHSDESEQLQRIRKPGGGRKKVEHKEGKLIEDLNKIMDENTIGDPMNLLKWTNKSTYSIADEMNQMGYKISPNTVARLLKESEYSLQANVKSIEVGTDIDRDEQFQYINNQVKQFIRKKNPVISVDTKKRELVGNFKNNGTTWEKKNNPKKVNVYDFRTLADGVAIPYGIYDILHDDGFVNVGISYDTSEFAVESIRQWWYLLGRVNYPDTQRLLITADGGGSNGSRRRGWKYYLQEFSDETRITITICHFPPGTSKWNKIEHRLFSFISMNWKGKPLVSYDTIIDLISATATKSGLTVIARLDERDYSKGKEFTENDMERLSLQSHKTFPKWNYTITPRL
jgi:hypothetical protein